MSEALWIATEQELPADGQQVFVKTLYGSVEHRMTFRADPEPRWETPSLIVSDIDMYAYWRPLRGKRKTGHSTSDAQASL